MATSLEDLVWHDGVIESVSVLPGFTIGGTGEMTFEVSLYPIPEASKRNRYRIVLKNVIDTQVNVDFEDLADNQRAGNISNGGAKDCGASATLLRIYLVHGYIEARFSGTPEISHLDAHIKA